jgi:hypothetical protein
MIDGVLWVSDELRSIGSYEELGGLRRTLAEVEDNLGAGVWKDVHLEICSEYGSQYMAFCGYRQATAEEIKRNNEYLARSKKAQEDRDRADFERLKKKFEEKT